MELKKILNDITSADYSAFFYTPAFYNEAYSYLFKNPFEIITIDNNRHLNNKLVKIDQLIKEGYSSYSIINYEAGYLFEKKLNPLLENKKKLIRYFFFKSKDVIKYDSSSLTIDDRNDKYSVKNFKLNVSKTEFVKSIGRIKNYIQLGDTYQVNYTIKGKYNFEGEYSHLFVNLLYNQSAQFSCFINSGNEMILSISPELFFRVDGREISTRPMKGTARRGIDLQSDGMIKYNLSLSEKNRAENVMIVDLLRNDLGRISEFGSVEVQKLFDVEKYESLYQMVSSITAKLKKDITFTDIIKNIFPCGSITGAPKIRTMEIINEIEKEPRGCYTGSIGFIHKKKKVFNVAIRTLVINKKSEKGEIGLGSGIVWDSDAKQEYEETLLKSKFLTKPEGIFELFETMLLENGNIALLEDHLSRLKATASYFLFIFDEKEIPNKIRKEILKVGNQSKQKIKLYLNKWGKVKFEISQALNPPEDIKIIVSDRRVSTGNRFQYFKTTKRKLYETEYSFYSKRGYFDVIYFNEKNELTEGSITNIFIRSGGTILTPPLTSGLLAGVYRKYMLRGDSNIVERTLYFEDLVSAEEIMLTNALKGEIKVNRLYLNQSEYKTIG